MIGWSQHELTGCYFAFVSVAINYCGKHFAIVENLRKQCGHTLNGLTADIKGGKTVAASAWTETNKRTKETTLLKEPGFLETIVGHCTKLHQEDDADDYTPIVDTVKREACRRLFQRGDGTRKCKLAKCKSVYIIHENGNEDLNKHRSQVRPSDPSR